MWYGTFPTPSLPCPRPRRESHEQHARDFHRLGHPPRGIAIRCLLLRLSPQNGLPAVRSAAILLASGLADRESLFLYLHVPFCEVRCGFCNLFTPRDPRRLWSRSTAARWRQIETLQRRDLPAATFTRQRSVVGRRRFLAVEHWSRLLRIVPEVPVHWRPDDSESRGDVARDLRRRNDCSCWPTAGVQRISLGVQIVRRRPIRDGWDDRNARARSVGALDRIRPPVRISHASIVDLIYGHPEVNRCRHGLRRCATRCRTRRRIVFVSALRSTGNGTAQDDAKRDCIASTCIAAVVNSC